MRGRAGLLAAFLEVTAGLPFARGTPVVPDLFVLRLEPLAVDRLDARPPAGEWLTARLAWVTEVARPAAPAVFVDASRDFGVANGARG